MVFVCGAACKSAAGGAGSNGVNYQWQDGNGDDIDGATSREYDVFTKSEGVLSYKCSITNCGSLVSNLITVTVGGKVFEKFKIQIPIENFYFTTIIISPSLRVSVTVNTLIRLTLL